MMHSKNYNKIYNKLCKIPIIIINNHCYKWFVFNKNKKEKNKNVKKENKKNSIEGVNLNETETLHPSSTNHDSNTPTKGILLNVIEEDNDQE